MGPHWDITVDDPVTRLKLSMGPIRGPGPVAYTRRHDRALMLPKKRQSIYNDRESLETKLNEWRHAFIINVKRKVTIPAYKVDTQMEHDQSSYFCRGPDDFCWGHAPVSPTLVLGPTVDINSQVANCWRRQRVVVSHRPEQQQMAVDFADEWSNTRGEDLRLRSAQL